MKKCLFSIIYIIPILINAQSSTDIMNQHNSCKAELADKVRALQEKKLLRDQMLRELRSGLCCSKCGKSKTELDKSEGFKNHLDFVDGKAVPLSAAKFAEKEREYNNEINSVQSEIDNHRRRCDDLFEKHNDALEREFLERQRASEKAAQEMAARKKQEEEEMAAKKKQEEDEMAKLRAEEEENKRLEREAEQERARLEQEARAAEEAARRQSLFDQAEASRQKMEVEQTDFNTRLSDARDFANDIFSQINYNNLSIENGFNYKSSDDIANKFWGNDYLQNESVAAMVIEKSKKLVVEFNNATDRLSGYLPDNIMGKTKDALEGVSEISVSRFIKQKLMPENLKAPFAWLNYANEGASSVRDMGKALQEVYDKAFQGEYSVDEVLLHGRDAIIKNMPFKIGKVVQSFAH